MANILRDSDGQVTRYAWPGGYSVSYLADDGEMICAECVQNEDCIHEDGDADGWRIDGHYVNWEGPSEFCSNCNKEVPSEYGDPDNA